MGMETVSVLRTLFAFSLVGVVVAIVLLVFGSHLISAGLAHVRTRVQMKMQLKNAPELDDDI